MFEKIQRTVSHNKSAKADELFRSKSTFVIHQSSIHSAARLPGSSL